MEPRVEPAEEARHTEAMHRLGVYGTAWAYAKLVTKSDKDRNQSRLLLTDALAYGDAIAELFPELGELGPDGNNLQHRVPVTILNADGVEEAACICCLPVIGGYRIMGCGWGQFVVESGISTGDRIDVYTCSRGDGERCLFFFKK